jgi:DNA-binding NarL/FixJ family response regulator
MSMILLVDDSPVERRLNEAMIRKNIPFSDVVLAKDGAEAMEEVEKYDFDLIVTDFQMPRVNGIQVVEHVTRVRPGLPVIVLTGCGSESTAVKALQAGAASYLVKKDIGKRLIETINNVLALSQSRHNRRRIISSQTMQAAKFELENDISLVTPLIAFLQDQLQSLQLCDAQILTRIGIALHETLTNAIYHGNLELDSELRQEDENIFYELADHRRCQEPYSGRRVFVEATANRDSIQYVIRDEGPGFDIHRVIDPTTEENLSRPSGRGLLLIRSFMDEVRHNAAGNEIALSKWIRKESAVPACQPQQREISFI